MRLAVETQAPLEYARFRVLKTCWNTRKTRLFELETRKRHLFVVEEVMRLAVEVHVRPRPLRVLLYLVEQRLLWSNFEDYRL